MSIFQLGDLEKDEPVHVITHSAYEIIFFRRCRSMIILHWKGGIPARPAVAISVFFRHVVKVNIVGNESDLQQVRVRDRKNTTKRL